MSVFVVLTENKEVDFQTSKLRSLYH